MKTANLLWKAITPVHAGTGQNNSGYIDSPTAREAGTRYPYIPASSVKGAFRDGADLDLPHPSSASSPVTPTQAQQRFGYGDALGAMGDLTFTDARILCLPVPSFAGTYALVTCPLVLDRLVRDRRLLGIDTLPCPAAPAMDEAVICGSCLVINGKVVLNDVDLTPHDNPGLQEFWKTLTGQDAERLCLVNDQVFAFFCDTALEISAHIRLQPDQKTVTEGGLWYQESLPAETLMTSFILSRSNDLSIVDELPWLQLGGRSTTGQGMMILETVAHSEGA
ncbi:MAG: type III-B CRISPR module RAMP protein Cmr4 [Propionibacteriaceae bacterium]|nr:type III-B CRISPR module RAMP protein Cmr4 [Propionibacteriaceae bacterium]